MTDPRPGGPDPGTGARRRAAPVLVVLAVAAGALGAAGSILFRTAIEAIQSLAFYAGTTAPADPYAHMAPAAWGAGIVLVPVLGGVAVIWVTRRLAPEVRGSGVPEVLDAIYHHGGRIRLRVAIAKVLASGLSIGSGASVGREGPIVHIGAVFGAALAALGRLRPHQRIVVVAASAGAGIAATFNAPLGGLAFAIELLLVSVTARNVALVATAVVVATWINGFYAGFGPVFPLPALAGVEGAWLHAGELALCVPLGIAAGLGGAALARGIYAVEDASSRLPGNDYLRHAAAMLLVGAMLYALVERTGAYHIAGAGYATIEEAVAGMLGDPGFLLLLFAAKLAATSLSLGTGASGGVFAPSLFLGATLGAAWAQALGLAWPGVPIEPAAFALAGMAALVATTTGAVVTAMVMVLELSQSYAGALPIVLTTGTALLVRARLMPDSVYTLKLVRRGRRVPRGLQSATEVALDAGAVMSTDFEIVEQAALDAGDDARSARYTVVTDGGAVVGLLLPGLRVARDTPSEAVEHRFRRVAADTRWPELMRIVRDNRDGPLIVADAHDGTRVRGVITVREIAAAERDASALLE